MVIEDNIKQEIMRLYNIIKPPPREGVIKESPARHDSTKMDALNMLVRLDNKYLKGTFKSNNTSCPSCVGNLLRKVENLMRQWQIDKK